MNEPQRAKRANWTTYSRHDENGVEYRRHEVSVNGEVVATYLDIAETAEHIVELMSAIERLRELIASVASHPEHTACGCAVCQELADEADRILSGGQ